MRMLFRRSGPSLIALVCVGGLLPTVGGVEVAEAQDIPTYVAEPSWPSVPDGWVLGEVTSIDVDPADHIWVLHRPRSIPEEQRADAAPPVLEFDVNGRLLRSWGGPGDGYDWPEREHGIHVDEDGFVWITGNGGWPKAAPGTSTDDMILKFTQDGELVRQIGRQGGSDGDGDTVNVHQPGDAFVYAPSNELYVADGYGNHRVIVFDAETGAYRRMWGAFGNEPKAPTPRGRGAAPPDPETESQFGLVHAVKVSNDGIVYVADRGNSRIQLFTTEGEYLRQVVIDGDATPAPAGFAFSPDPDQRLLYVIESSNARMLVYERASMTLLGQFGSRSAEPGGFDIAHHIAMDSVGNLYIAEIVTNRRAQKLVPR